MTASINWAEYAAREFEKAVILDTDERRWATPGELHQVISPGVVQTPALELIDRELVALVDNDDFDRLAVFVSPQEGKSERVSHAFALWLLTQNPELRVAIVSYSDEMARRHGSAIKLDALTFNGTDGELDLGIRLREDTRAAGRWQIDGHAGGVYCVGIGGSLTGKAVDVLLVDDPLKDLEQAQSDAYRKRAMNFWRAVAVPRLGPGAKVVLIQTRWHEADMGGQLLAEEPDKWRVVSIPAIAEKEDDPLGRKVGEPMISARGDRDWAGIRRSVGEYVWAALYQQRPAPAEGGLYKRDKFRYWTPRPGKPNDGNQLVLDLDGQPVVLRDTWRFLVADLAASVKTSADYTVIAAFAITDYGDIILLDLHRSRMTPDKHLDAARPMFTRWGAHTLYVEQMMHTATLVHDAGRAGIPVTPLQPDRDKITRALPATARVEQRKVWLPQGAAWVGDFLDELASFPNSANDDMADCLAYAARIAGDHWIAPEPDVVIEARRRREAKAERTADPFADVDLMTAQW